MRIVRVDLFVVWVFMALLLGTPLAFLVVDHVQRRTALESGQRAEAIVAGQRIGDSRWGMTCNTVFAFRAAGRIHRFERPDECPDAWPTGARVEVAFNPADPGGAFPVSEGSWFRGMIWVPAALAAALIAISAYLLIPAFRPPRH